MEGKARLGGTAEKKVQERFERTGKMLGCGAILRSFGAVGSGGCPTQINRGKQGFWQKRGMKKGIFPPLTNTEKQLSVQM